MSRLSLEVHVCILGGFLLNGLLQDDWQHARLIFRLGEYQQLLLVQPCVSVLVGGIEQLSVLTQELWVCVC